MIVVDSSVWIAHFRNESGPAVDRLRDPGIADDIVVGDLVLLECLQGARNEAHARRIEAALRTFPVEGMLDASLAVEGAAAYRLLRSRGVTPRKTVDIIIAAYCIRHGHSLLHQDRDFDLFAAHLPLRIA